MDKVVVPARGFVDEREVQSSERAIDLSALRVTQEEAHTCLIVHCVNSSLDSIVVSARDTDVLLLLIAYVPHIPCPNLYMMSLTGTKRKYFNIRAIYENLPAGPVSPLLPFHALMGCDTTSFICNHSKKSAWEVFVKHHALRSSLGEGELTEEKMKEVEEFVCKMYKLDQLTRPELFCSRRKESQRHCHRQVMLCHYM